MTDLVLYHAPGACSQVARFALEEAGLSYELKLVDFSLNEQASPAYAPISPLGKVPALVIDGAPLTENAAIITYIAELAPQAGLFPADRSPLALARRVSGLSFCGGTLHPIVRGVLNPARLTDGDQAGVRQKATSLGVKSFGYADKRLAEFGWWLGEWSVVDVYLNWTVVTAAKGGFDFSPFPHLAGLKDRLLERPAFKRMVDGEVEASAELARRREAA